MKLNLIRSKFRDILRNTLLKMTQNSTNPNYIDAEPTKDLFISMLVKDISLKDAIGDLVDNSVDGARSHAVDRTDLRGFWIHITATSECFKIVDNCGGIPVHIAKNHAFRFGRPESYTPASGSIGQFGIGMKRAFFKIGKDIKLNSVEASSRFDMRIDVDRWKDDPKWNFNFVNLSETDKNHSSTTGTDINIEELTSEVKNSFSDGAFLNELTNEIALEQMLNINRGLVITINNIPLVSPKITLKSSDDLKPYYFKHDFDKSSLSIEILAGVSEDSAEDGGWYVFCNDRLIMGKDKTSATGWTGKFGDGVAEYHDQFYRFRGYAFFFADNVKDLPWNTTKTGMNLDAPQYKFARSKMIDAMRMVMTLLNKMKSEKEKNNPIQNRVLNNRIEEIKPQAVNKVLEQKDKFHLDDKFIFPPVFQKPPKSEETSISYKVSNAKFEEIKEHTGLTKPVDIGLHTFNYFFDNEIG